MYNCTVPFLIMPMSHFQYADTAAMLYAAVCAIIYDTID